MVSNFFFFFSEDEDEDMGDMAGVIENSEAGAAKRKHKAKLLSFCENRRPAYWGTWSKKSTCVSARNPFANEVSWEFINRCLPCIFPSLIIFSGSRSYEFYFPEIDFAENV